MSLRAVYFFLRFVAILIREIVLANIAVTKLALGPLERLRSGFVAVPLDARSDLEITSFANSITLTPGTITAHVDPARKLLVMHAIDIGEDPEVLRKTTKAVLEDSVLRWTRASSLPQKR